MMAVESCRGCVRAREVGGVAVPGSPVCLGCRRAGAPVPADRDLWLAGPPGGSPVTVDERGICFAVPLAGEIRSALTALILLLGAAWLLEGGLPTAFFLIAGTLTGARALSRRARVRHYWAVMGGHVWHLVSIGGITLRRVYPAEAVHAFHCAGMRGGGPVGFHHGPYTVQVAMLPHAADNQWLMRRLNEHLARARRRET